MRHLAFSLAVVSLTAGVLIGSLHFNRPEMLWGLAGVGVLLYRWLDASAGEE